MNGAFAEASGEGFEGPGVFGGDDEAGGVFVEAVDDAGADSIAAEGVFEAGAVVQKALNQGAAGVADGRMDDDSLLFVDDQAVAVFVDYGERQGLRSDFGGRGGVPVDDDVFSAAEFSGHFYGSAVGEADADRAAGDLTAGKEAE